ncbi:hypothetical protein LOK49_LG10G01306 [Camellia lanceoleosa]|uniref:Uncharacterized protein n=1 Tax=Camellia lanceoleosa TaxID=1840588 RepID=A0ACC0GD55_9ERIC|nr:hypothetical protein LOK49_LG10G01306 [Camellia lanceoleosa]
MHRISTSEEWEALQKTGTTLGGELNLTKTDGFIHLSNLHQMSSIGETNDVIDLSRASPSEHDPQPETPSGSKSLKRASPSPVYAAIIFLTLGLSEGSANL